MIRKNVSSLLIRTPVEEDVERALPLCKSFHDETAGKYGLKFNELDARSVIEFFVDGCGLSLVAEVGGELVGFICGTVQPYPLCVSQKIFKEVFWYVKPEYRGAVGKLLYQEVIFECEERGVDVVWFANQESYMKEPLEHFYARNGFNPLETSWVKVLND